jgi:magnesium-protoporphyrin O-methyltransferase
MSCPQCEGIELVFDEESIAKERKFYERDGADKTTLWLVEAIKEAGVEGLSLLDIGGGLGAIQHELLSAGAKKATHVDASSAYIEAAKEEAKQRKLSDKIEWRHGDFVDLASELDSAGVVTLDRVICCYDNMVGLVGNSVKLAERYYGVVYPRNLWWAKIGFRLINLVERIMGNPFRTFMHSSEKVDALITKAGFARTYSRNTFLWQVQLYSKA